MGRFNNWKRRLQLAARANKRFMRSVRRKHKVYVGRPVGPARKATERAPLAYDSTLAHLAKHYKRMSNGAPGPREAIALPGGATGVRLFVPSIFSLAHAPAASFLFLRDLFELLHRANTDVLVLDYRHCVRLDVDASACMDVLLLRFRQYYRQARQCGQGRRIRYLGAENLRNLNVRKQWYSAGSGQVIKGVQVSFADMITCPLQVCFKSPHRKGRKEITTTELVKYLIACLARFEHRLSPADIARFSNIIGEIITNAEDHSSLPYNYSMGHFYEIKEEGGQLIGRFQCVIFNFGKTIYERLKDPEDCKNKAILPEMENLSKRYTERRLFGLLDAPFEEETLWTLYALQDGVSSIESGRGNGTMQFIQDFLNLRSRQPNQRSVLTLLSGNTRIELDGTHPPREQETDGERHTVITFNKSGSLEEPPDKKFVTFAPPYFPGTLLYADVFLTADPLTSH